GHFLVYWSCFLCIFRSWHCSTGDKEHVGSNGGSIGARTKEIRTLQDRRKSTLS
ncbi:hypothetical protein LINPERPRIM_LOCUS17057, partial [Linum perenne]